MAQLKTYNIRQIELLQSLADISLHHCPVLDGIPAASVQKLAVLPFQIEVCFPQFSYTIVYPASAGGPAQAHVGAGGGGSSSDLSWDEQKNRKGGRKQ